MIPHSTIRDKDLPDSAGWLLVNLLSNSDDWKVTIKSLELDGRFGSHDKITKNLKILRLLGYARLTRLHSGESVWDFTDSKGQFAPDSENQVKAEPHPEKPNSEKPNSENQNVLSNNKYSEITKEKKYAPSVHLRSHGAQEKLIEQWFAVRSKKRLTNTEVAMELFLSEVNKSGKDINDVLRKCAQESWGGFKSSWAWDKQDSAKSEPVRQRRYV